MLPQGLSPGHSEQSPPRSGNSSAQTSASLHPPASLRLRVLPFTRGMVAHGLCGRVPDSAGNLSPWIASAQTDANLSTHLYRLPTPPPYLRQMRLLPGRVHRYWVPEVAAVWRGCGCWVQDKADAWPCSPFLQFTARANPCSRHLWGTLARAVASI